METEDAKLEISRFDYNLIKIKAYPPSFCKENRNTNIDYSTRIYFKQFNFNGETKLIAGASIYIITGVYIENILTYESEYILQIEYHENNIIDSIGVPILVELAYQNLSRIPNPLQPIIQKDEYYRVPTLYDVWKCIIEEKEKLFQD